MAVASMAFVGGSNAELINAYREYGSQEDFDSLDRGCQEFQPSSTVMIDYEIRKALASRAQDDRPDTPELVSKKAPPTKTDPIFTEPNVEDVKSVAMSFGHQNFDIATLAEQVLTIYDHKIMEFEVPELGISFELYSDTDSPNYTFYPDKFAEAFLKGLPKERVFTNPRVQAIMNCWRSRLLDKRVAKGRVYKLFIPSDYRICLNDGVMKRTDSDCHSGGFTPPQLTFSLLNWDILNEDIMILAPGADNPEEAKLKIYRFLQHERYHSYLNLNDWPLRVDPDEQLVKYMLKSTRETRAELLSPETGDAPFFIEYH